jgi:putative spermidine/putrescine transport system permease protein
VVLSLLSPTLLSLLAFFVTPVAILVTYSFYEAKPGGIMHPDFVLTNYIRFLGDPFHLRILWTTIKLGFGVTVITLVTGYPVAYVLARTRSRLLRGLGITAVLIPLMTSVVVRSYGWMILLASNGLINKLLLFLGISDQPVQMMFTTTGVVIALGEVFLPFMILTVMPVIQGIDPALEQASMSLGAGPFRTFRNVTLPLSMPGVAAGSILVFVLTIGAFATPRLVGGAKTQVASLFVYDQALQLFNWPFGAATSMIILVIVLLLTYFQTRLLENKRIQGQV